MAVLGRVNWLSQQRVDLSHMLADQSFSAYDWRAAMRVFNGFNKNYVVKGLEINGVSGLSVSVNIADSVILMPLDGTASFFTADSNEPSQLVILPPSIDNIFVEAYLERSTQTAVTTAFFDPGLTSESNPAGSEFTAASDFQQVVELKFRFKTDGFTPDAIPVAVVKTSSTQVDTVTDARDMFFRLGTGGGTPNPFARFDWSALREETSNPGNASAIGQFTSANPYYVQDADGAKNDKAITNLKEWMNAVMTVIAEMKGTPTWYTPTAGKTVPNLLFLSPSATTYFPTTNRTIRWDGTNLSSRKNPSENPSNFIHPATFGMTYGPVRWYLGGSFSSGRKYDLNTEFSVEISPRQSVFILLERETLPAGVLQANVKWGVEDIDSSTVGIPTLRQVKGLQGDFTGIAIGDYIRKNGDDYFQYYRVTGFVENNALTSWPDPDVLADNINHLNWGAVATSACIGLILEKNVDSTGDEPYLWFRAAYQDVDVYKTDLTNTFRVQSNSPSPLSIPVDDINLFYLGTRGDSSAAEFNLRWYGSMSPGEEVSFLGDSDSALKSIESDFFVRADHGVEFSGAGVLSSLNPNKLTIQKRKVDNYVADGVGNQNALQTFVINNDITFANDGDCLWVRLSDNLGSPSPQILSAGSVDPAGNPPGLNVYEVLPANTVPLKNFRNKNVALIARRTTINGVASLQLLDGSIIQVEGKSIERDLTKVVTATTHVSNTTTVSHNYQRNTTDFLWSARRTATGVVVNIGATQNATGLVLDPTPGGAEDLTITFTRNLQ